MSKTTTNQNTNDEDYDFNSTKEPVADTNPKNYTLSVSSVSTAENGQLERTGTEFAIFHKITGDVCTTRIDGLIDETKYDIHMQRDELVYMHATGQCQTDHY